MRENKLSGGASPPSVLGGGDGQNAGQDAWYEQPTLDRYYGRGIEFTCRAELHRELYFLYRRWRWKKLLRLRRAGAKHSDYVVTGDHTIQVLVNHRELTIRAIQAMETTGPAGADELDTVTIVLCDGTELHLDHLRPDDDYYSHVDGTRDYTALNVEALMEAVQ